MEYFTRINTDTDLNMQDVFSAGKETVTQMEGQAIFSYTYEWKAKVEKLSASPTIKIKRQRIFCANQTKHNCLKQYKNIYLHQKLLNWRSFQILIIISLMVVLFCNVYGEKKDPPVDQLLRCIHRSLWITMVRPLLSLMDILEDQVQKTNPISDSAPKLQIRLIYQLQHNLLDKRFPC